ncbi:MAG: sodium-translocating pyrophosphatase [Planctomycetota bacterium]|nr:sodium-translocating pyrophosphatase [Planctomycetota bacterium]
MFKLIWGISFVCALIALLQAYLFFKKMQASDEGNERMVEIAGYVREGANAYLTQQYKVVAIFFVVIFILLAIAAYGLGVQSKWVPFAFITGGFFSGLAGWYGMKTATWASSRTAAGAQKSLNQGLQVAFRSGAVMGLTVVGLGLLDITLWFLVLHWLVPKFGFEVIGLDVITVTMLCFGMGASAQALFARVGGGIFTKAADVGADLVGKVEQGIPEDDARNPATIADNVGDNVGDVAGMGADLYESYCGSILATAALGVAAFASGTVLEDRFAEITGAAGGVSEGDIGYFQMAALFLPIAIAAVGILLSIFGIYLVQTEDKASQSVLLKALGRGINTSTFLVIFAAVGLTYWLFDGMFLSVSISVVVGLLAGWIIGKWTEYSTSDEFKPTQDLAEQAVTGPATLIIGGVAEGMKSVWVPVIVVCVATLAAFACAIGDLSKLQDVQYFALGLYGVGIAAVGMLSTLGITLATDAYGPIADNAGGNAEMSELEPIVRERTDALDSLGNTTAATGKGFAIGSAALTALALLAAYVEEVRVGFEHMEEAIVEQFNAPGYYKVTPQFVTVVEDTGEEGGLAHRGLMILDGARNSEWVALPLGEKVADNALVEHESGRWLTHSHESGESRLSVVDRAAATLPDFTRYYDASLMNPKVLIGVFLGAMATFVFCAMTMKAVGRAAKGMVEEVRRQFRENPGIMERTSKPDYAAPVAISTKAAQKEMILPSLLGLVLPLVVGVVLGVGGVMGLLVGTLTCGFCVAIYMSNAGGAWDNAKKYIEAGAHGGKGTEAHKAAVVGDTVGDPFKDTSGPSLNILIKLMSMVSVVAAGLVVRYSLMALGIF